MVSGCGSDGKEEETVGGGAPGGVRVHPVICNHTGWWWLATIISFVVCALLTKILGALKFRVDMLEMKSMLGNYLLFLMLALGICILFINEPFTSIL